MNKVKHTVKPGTKTQSTKPRGRPRSDKTTTQIANSRVGLEVDRIEEAHSAGRPPRVSMSSGLSLLLPHGLVDESKFHCRWFSEKDGRVLQSYGAYWEHVKDHQGNNIVRHKGLYNMFLMKIDIKYWENDQKLKADKVSATLKKEQTLADDEYVPKGRHHVLQKDNDDYDPLA